MLHEEEAIRLIRREELPPNANRTVQFEGERYRAGISFFLIDNEPARAPVGTVTPPRRRRGSARR